MQIRFLALALLLGAGTHGSWAADVYRIVSPDGTVAFSDQPRPGAERVQLPAAPARARQAEAIERARRATADMLEIAAALEQARLRREQLRTERALQRLALRQSTRAADSPAEPAYERYGGVGWLPVAAHGFRHRHRPPRPAMADPVFERSPYAPPPFGPPAFRQ